MPFRSLAAEAQLCASTYDLKVVKDAMPAEPRLYLAREKVQNGQPPKQ